MEKIKILLIEDEPNVQFMMKEMLEFLGCDVTPASLASEAVRYSEKNTYDYYFVDIVMPDMDGLEAVERMLLMDIPEKVVVISANLNTVNVEKARRLGIEKFVAKPVKMYDLKRIFKEKDDEKLHSDTENH
ncbi:MAG: response regulator [Candidatus Aureabacteria bacterium]|nr:response regulator [Candidatus Auribacterota bacterium]